MANSLVAMLVALPLLLAACIGAPRIELGVREGRLNPCPTTKNCVSTHGDSPSNHIAPIAYTVPAEEAMRAIHAAVVELPRARIVAAEPLYLHAEVGTTLSRSVDDLEIYLDDAAKLVHMRSIARSGFNDMGANRRRLVDLSKKLKPALAERSGR